MGVIKLFAIFLLACCVRIISAQAPCAQGLEQCSPVGASGREVPVIGPDLARFYLELIYTVRGMPGNSKATVHTPVARQTDFGDSLCCADSSTCSMIRSFRIAFCWVCNRIHPKSVLTEKDRFTTSYFLPDGSYGSASNGSYTTVEGDTANLITGEYHMRDGTVGNIYNESPADKPESDELPLPTPFTSSGVGSAIPASQLGAQLSASVTSSSGSAALSSSSPTSTASVTSASVLPSTSTSSTTPITTTTATTSTGGITPGPITSSSTSASTSSTTAGPSSESLPSSRVSSLGTLGSAGPSSTRVNGSYPIIPPITNLATATVVYCMAAKVLVWLVTAIMV